MEPLEAQSQQGFWRQRPSSQGPWIIYGDAGAAGGAGGPGGAGEVPEVPVPLPIAPLGGGLRRRRLLFIFLADATNPASRI